MFISIHLDVRHNGHGNPAFATAQLGAVELLDEEMVHAVNKYADMDLPESPCLLFKFTGEYAHGNGQRSAQRCAFMGLSFLWFRWVCRRSVQKRQGREGSALSSMQR
jgi:hypothetical protein